MILIVSSEAHAVRLFEERRPSHVVSLRSPGTKDHVAFDEATSRLSLVAHDITEPAEGLVMPDLAMAEALLGFSLGWGGTHPLLVYCWAGVSRSTAAAFAIACLKRPETAESIIAATLRAASPTATPNRLIVALADRLLGRCGRMVSAIDRIDRGVEFRSSGWFELELCSWSC